jgi:hypothetical protein
MPSRPCVAPWRADKAGCNAGAAVIQARTPRSASGHPITAHSRATGARENRDARLISLYFQRRSLIGMSVSIGNAQSPPTIQVPGRWIASAIAACRFTSLALV